MGAQNVTFPSNGKQAHGYLALPPGGRGPGVLVVQEWWGLTTHITTMADRFAAEGFTVLAPDLFGGETVHSAAEAAERQRQLPVEGAVRDLSGAVDFLLAQPGTTGDAVAVVGFCMGGDFGLRLAVREGDRVVAAVPFYGVPREPDYSYLGLTAHVLGHYGEYDKSIPTELVDEAAIRIGEATDRRPEIHFYPAGHAFMNEENPSGNYDPLQAAIAWQRTLTFLRGHLG
ncbi:MULTISPECIES: dienelactone hydrolase family protein [Kitasatospora]|uniref:dienelactone hydrolase family protein n=1 Tax=Kitasatospora TaxID=2063 RepID=UPI000C7015E5|nr:dienelactone hydrolase family protein [Kitasatospora sp. GP30]MDH6142306.1 carboxymethylenebutenolidase [Kitasatospora sp. GP30]